MRKTYTVIMIVGGVLAAVAPAAAGRAGGSAHLHGPYAAAAELVAASWRARQLALFTLGYGSYYGYGWPLYARESTGYGYPYNTYGSYYAFAPQPCGYYPVYGCRH